MTNQDKRIMMLAIQADVEAEASMSFESHPAGEIPVDGEKDPGWPWLWCDITVRASYAGIRAEELLKGQSWVSASAFYRSDVYRSACLKVLTLLLGRLDAAADMVATVGAKRVTGAKGEGTKVPG